MRGGYRRAPPPADRGDVEGALAALGADDLRAFVAETLDDLEPEVRGPIEDALLRRAAARSDFRPAAPDVAIVDEVVAFVAAARHAGAADPFEVDEYLRRAVAASLAGEHGTARAIFEALFEPIREGDIHLGQDEMVDEVLSVDLYDCVAQYLVAVYFDTPASERAEAIVAATDRVDGLCVPVEPVRDMERAYGRALPEIATFLDAWIARLEASTKRGGEWSSDHDRWLRDAVARRDGVAGLARIARSTRQPEALRAWCDALVRERSWKEALAAFEEAAVMISESLWRGDFLDGAALAAHELARKDATQKLEAAWVAAPSLARLVRWLVADDANAALVRERAAATLKNPPTKADSIVAFLHVLGGDPTVAATLLAGGAGLGWSSAEHPGHLLFPTFVWLLGDAPAGSVAAELVESLRARPHSLLDFDAEAVDVADTDVVQVPRAVPACAVLEVLERAAARERVTASHRAHLLEALRKAAAVRADGVTDEKRRRHYDHAAKLVVCCAEIEGPAGNAWLEAIRKRTSRFPAFQDALRRARAGGGRSPSSLR